MSICKYCEREISEFSLFNEYIPQFQCCEFCLEKAIEMGMIEGELELDELE